MKKLIPFALLAAAFVYFAWRDRQKAAPASRAPETVLLDMVQAMADNDVRTWLDCFGGEMGSQLQDLFARRGKEELQRTLKERCVQMKGFAIVDRQPEGPDRLRVLAETVYNGKNTRQTFVLQQQGGRWKIIRSDSEAVSNWNNNYGKPATE